VHRKSGQTPAPPFAASTPAIPGGPVGRLTAVADDA